MATGGDARYHDECLAGALRRYINLPDANNRQVLARCLVSYVCAYLRSYLPRRRFGFNRPVAEVAVDIADMEVAALLRCEGSARLIEVMRPLLSRREPVTPELLEMSQVSDADLAAAIKQLLRMRSQQGAILAWKEEHPQEGHTLRSLKSQISRTGGVRIHRDASGQIIVSPRSDLRMPPLGSPEIASILVGVAPPYRISAVVREIIPSLIPENGFGGYCFLMDLVRTIHLLRFEAVTHDALGTGAAPSEPDHSISGDGTPFSLKLDKVTERLSAWAEQIHSGDLEKRNTEDPGGSFGDGHARNLIVEIAVDRILSPVGLGRPEWADLSLEAVIALTHPSTPGRPAAPPRVNEVDYLIRRLRLRMRRQWRELL